MRRYTKRMLEKLTCIHKERGTKTPNCERHCNGITNSCGEYRNPYNIDPFINEFMIPDMNLLKRLEYKGK